MKTLREKIKTIVYHESDMDKIMVLIQKEVKECLPKELIGQPNTLGVQGSIGYNQALSDIHTKLSEKGII